MIIWLCLYVKHISFETEMPKKFLVQSHKSCQVSFECRTQTSQGQKIQPAANVGVLGVVVIAPAYSVFAPSFRSSFLINCNMASNCFFGDEGDGETDKEDVCLIVILFIVLK